MSNSHKLLIVDDDPVNLEFFQIMLAKLGFIIEEAKDGVEALEKLADFFPNLILLDNNMPRMTGWELTRRLKNDPTFRNVPIIMFSSMNDISDMSTGYSLGVDDYITKPFNFAEVLARIKVTLRNRELFSQVALRESKLILAEALHRDMKNASAGFIGAADELNSALESIKPSDDFPAKSVLEAIQEKNNNARAHAAELNARIDKVALEWEDLKKDEIDLSALENRMRNFLNQDLD